MKNKLVHPLWMHIPVMVSFITLIGSIIVSLPLPARAPVHFGFNNLPDRYGSPWEVVGITLFLAILFTGISILLDELWARQEKAKSFNWLTFLDELVVGAMTGFTVDYLLFLNSGATEYSPSWTWPVLSCLVMVFITMFLEFLRPYKALPEKISEGENSELKAEVSRRIGNQANFVYWDNQNPFYMTLITTLLPIVMVISAALTWGEQTWVSIILFLTGLLLLIPNGGQRVMVTREGVTVRWGLIGLKVLHLPMDQIISAELRNFSPLKDFGGYGIRFNREMKAYYLQGSTGVVIETTEQKKYLIGSNKPENLLTVINTIQESR